MPQTSREPDSRIAREVAAAASSGVLKVPNMSLVSVPPSVLRCLPLTVLDMSSNGFSSLPEGLCRLPCLKELHVTWCKLNVLPKNIGQLKNLKKLACGFNQLTSLPDSICSLAHLEVLLANDNSIAHLPTSIGRMESLREISVQYNQITELPESVALLGLLQVFNLRGNPLQNPSIAVVMEGARAIVDHMRSNVVNVIPMRSTTLTQDNMGTSHEIHPSQRSEESLPSSSPEDQQASPAIEAVATETRAARVTLGGSSSPEDQQASPAIEAIAIEARAARVTLGGIDSSLTSCHGASGSPPQGVGRNTQMSRNLPIAEQLLQPHVFFEPSPTIVHTSLEGRLSIEGRNPNRVPSRVQSGTSPNSPNARALRISSSPSQSPNARALRISSSPSQSPTRALRISSSPSNSARTPERSEITTLHMYRNRTRAARQIHWPRHSSEENTEEEDDVMLTSVLLDRNPELLQNLHDMDIMGEETNSEDLSDHDDVGRDASPFKFPEASHRPNMPDTSKAPKAFLCPILHELMVDPVLAADGHTYERSAIGKWFKKSDASPMTGQRVKSRDLLPNFTLKSMIQEWIDAENCKD